MIKNLREGYEEDIQEIVDLMNEHDYSDEAIAAVVCAYEDYDMTEEDVESIINDGDIEEGYEYVYGNGTSVRVGDMRFAVYNGDDDAYDAAKEDVDNLIDEVGITTLFPRDIWTYYLDEDSCESFFREDYEVYANDIVDEDDDTYGNRLVQECYDAGLLDDSDFEETGDGAPDYSECLLDENELVDRLVDYMVDRIDDFGEELEFNFGKDGVDHMIESGAISLDRDALVERYVEDYGVGGTLSGYDGTENEVEYADEDYWVYRIG